MKQKIIIFLLIYFILFYSNISKHNKKLIRHYFKSNNIFFFYKKLIRHYFKSNNIFFFYKTIRNLIIKYNISNDLLYLVKIIIFLIYFIILPPGSVLFGLIYHKTYNINLFKLIRFYLKNPLGICTELCLYNGLYLNNINLPKKDLNGLMSKIYWNNVFVKLKIKTPTIYGLISNGKIQLKKSLKSNKKYILKPVYGLQGRGIQQFDKNKDYSCLKDKYIIQEKIFFDNFNYPVHIRCITGYKNNKIKLLFLYLFINQNPNKIASNRHQGGIVYDIDLKNKTIKQINSNIKKPLEINVKKIKESIEKSIQIHKYFVNKNIGFNSIAFDIMIYKNQVYFLEGNLFHGCVFPDDVNFLDKYHKYVQNINI